MCENVKPPEDRRSGSPPCYAASDVTNKLVGELVMGWTQKDSDIWEKPDCTMIGRFAPLTIGSDDVQVLAVVRSWLDGDDRFETEGRYNVFYRVLSETLRSRDPYYRDTVNQFELYYLDLYEVGDFARAAFAAVVAA